MAPHILRRMRLFKTKLLNLRVGHGAVALSPDVAKVHLEFSLSRSNGNIYPAQFFSKCLSRLKWHNPTVTMTVDRFKDANRDAKLTVYFRDGATVPQPTGSAPQFVNGPLVISQPPKTPKKRQSDADKAGADSAAPEAGAETPVAMPTPSVSDQANLRYVLDMKHRHWTTILNELEEVTSAEPVKPSEEDLQQQQEVRNYLVRSAGDRQRAAEKKRLEDQEREYMANLA